MDTVNIIVDWGTSGFRAARLTSVGEADALLATDDGIARFRHGNLAAFLHRKLAPWSDANSQLNIVLIGMVGSALGWQYVPYLQCPADTDALVKAAVDLDLTGTPFPPATRARLVPGLQCINPFELDDVMRGEESQCAGWWLQAGRPQGRFLLCLPGTHSKWVSVVDGRITTFASLITGEMYQVLLENSLFQTENAPVDMPAFNEGLEQAKRHAFSLTAFSCRTRVVLGSLEKAVSNSYLSGLLIGDELRHITRHWPDLSSDVVVIGESRLSDLYRTALHQFGIRAELVSSDTCNAAFAAYYFSAVDE